MYFMKHIQPTKIWITRTTNGHDIDQGAIDELWNEIRPIVEKAGFKLSLAETYSLGMERLSIINCEECGQVCVDRDSNPIGLDQEYVPEDLNTQIYDGGKSDGRKLCELCLPTTHRWGHAS